MKKATIIIYFLSCAVTSTCSVIYPSWFLYPRLYPGLVTGFSYKGNPPVQDAEVMYCIYKSCDVEGYIESFSDNRLDFVTNVQYRYVYPADDLKRIEGRLHRLDRFILSVPTGDYVDAFAILPDSSIGKKRLSPDTLKRPSWTGRTTWDDGQYYYGVGVHTSYGNSSDCWKTSEEQAIFSILTSISMKFYSFHWLSENEKTKTAEYKEYTRTDLKFHLESIQTLERYPDTKNELYYTLVSIRKNKVRPVSFNPDYTK